MNFNRHSIFPIKSSPHLTCGWAVLHMLGDITTRNPSDYSNPLTLADKVTLLTRHGFIATHFHPPLDLSRYAGVYIVDGINVRAIPHTILIHADETSMDIWVYDPETALWSNSTPDGFLATNILLVEDAKTTPLSFEKKL